MKTRMMRIHNLGFRLSLLLLSLFSALPAFSQQESQLFKGHFYQEEEKVHLYLNLYEASLDVPGMSFLGKVKGYMNGNIYGTWLLTSAKIKNGTATLRLSNDSGADAQTIKFTSINDSVFQYEAVDGNCIKRVHKRKLVKIPNRLIFEKIKY